MTPEQLEKIDKLFEFARRAEISFGTTLQLRFNSDAESGEFVVYPYKGYDVDFLEFNNLEQAKQILLDMFSM